MDTWGDDDRGYEYYPAYLLEKVRKAAEPSA
jgi:hypothetical protein